MRLMVRFIHPSLLKKFDRNVRNVWKIGKAEGHYKPYILTFKNGHTVNDRPEAEGNVSTDPDKNESI